MRDGDRASQTRVETEPRIDLPLVDRAVPLGGEVRVVVAVLPAEHLEHRVVDVELVEQLLARQLGVAPPDVTRLAWPGVDAHAGVARSRIPLGDPRRPAAVAFEHSPSRRAQVPSKHRLGRLRMHVAVDKLDRPHRLRNNP